jgi:cytochrome c
MRAVWHGLTVSGLLLLAIPGSRAAEDDLGGLPPGPGQEEVFYVCNACHSIRLVTQQRLDRARWDKLLVWMVEEQGMPAFEPGDRDRVLDYLDRHFGAAVPR